MQNLYIFFILFFFLSRQFFISLHEIGGVLYQAWCRCADPSKTRAAHTLPLKYITGL